MLVVFALVLAAALLSRSGSPAEPMSPSADGAKRVEAARRAQRAAQAASSAAREVARTRVAASRAPVPDAVIAMVIGALRTGSSPEMLRTATELERMGYGLPAADLRAVATAAAFSGDDFDWRAAIEAGQEYATQIKGYVDQVQGLFGGPPQLGGASTIDPSLALEAITLNNEQRLLTAELEALADVPIPPTTSVGWLVTSTSTEPGTWARV